MDNIILHNVNYINKNKSNIKNTKNSSNDKLKLIIKQNKIMQSNEYKQKKRI